LRNSGFRTRLRGEGALNVVLQKNGENSASAAVRREPEWSSSIDSATTTARFLAADLLQEQQALIMGST
jgi:hypothetical protein